MTRDGRLAPGVATAWTVDADGLTYDFELREAEWSNGDPADGGGFRILLPPPARPRDRRALCEPVLSRSKNAPAVEQRPAARRRKSLSVRALGAATGFTIALERPTPYFLGLLAHQTAVPLHRGISLERYGREFARPGKLVGNGDYSAGGTIEPGDKLDAQTRSGHFHAAAGRRHRDGRRSCRWRIARRRCGASRRARSIPTPTRRPTRSPFSSASFLRSCISAPASGPIYYAFDTKEAAVRRRAGAPRAVDGHRPGVPGADDLGRLDAAGLFAHPARALPGDESLSRPTSPISRPSTPRKEAKRLLKGGGLRARRQVGLEMLESATTPTRTTTRRPLAVADMWPAAQCRDLLRQHGRQDAFRLYARAWRFRRRPRRLARRLSRPAEFSRAGRERQRRAELFALVEPGLRRAAGQGVGESATSTARAHLLAQAEAILMREQPIAPLMFLGIEEPRGQATCGVAGEPARPAPDALSVAGALSQPSDRGEPVSAKPLRLDLQRDAQSRPGAPRKSASVRPRVCSPRVSTTTGTACVRTRLGSSATATASGSCMTIATRPAAAAASARNRSSPASRQELASAPCRAESSRNAPPARRGRHRPASSGLLRHVEADRNQRRRALRAEGAESYARRFGVMPDIEFGGRRHVAAHPERAAHQHETLDLPDEVWRAQQRRARCW